MAKNYFIGDNTQAISRVYRELNLWFKERQYEVDGSEAEGACFIQAKKTGTIRTLLGTNIAFQIKVYWSKEKTINNEFTLETSTGKWMTNVAGAGVTAMFTGGFTVLTGLAGAGWALIVENEIISYIENNLKFEKIKVVDETIKDSSSNQDSATLDNSATFTARQKAINKVDQEEHKLEAAFVNGILTEEEYKFKKIALQDRIDEYEIEFLIEEKIAKFQQAFTAGILDAEEYEEKVKGVDTAVRKQFLKERYEHKKTEKIAKLKQALEHGILTQEEYKAKLAEINN